MREKIFFTTLRSVNFGLLENYNFVRGGTLV